MSVVSGRYDELKRFNLAEIFDPSPKEQPKPAVTTEPVSDEVPVGLESNAGGAKVEEP